MTGDPMRHGYLRELSRALAAAGIVGRTRRRILHEFADHLAAAPDAELGSPDEIARQFADELGTDLARRAALHAFAALAVAGAVVAVPVSQAALGQQRSGAVLPSLGALAVAAFSGQVAFVCGVLAVARAFQRRSCRVIGRDEAAVLGRRAGFGLLTGAVTLGCVAVAVPTGSHVGATTWVPATSAPGLAALMATGLAALMAAVPAVFGAARLRPQAAGAAGDLFADLGPTLGSLAQRITGGSTRRAAWMLSAALFAVVAAAGALNDDGYDGLVRGVAEAAACYGTYALLGRYLGLRRR